MRVVSFSSSSFVLFFHSVVCLDDVIVMYYSPYDVECQGDYYTQTKSGWSFTNDDDEIGRRSYDIYNIWFECSNTMFSSDWADAIANNSYAAEL